MLSDPVKTTACAHPRSLVLLLPLPVAHEQNVRVSPQLSHHRIHVPRPSYREHTTDALLQPAVAGAAEPGPLDASYRHTLRLNTEFGNHSAHPGADHCGSPGNKNKNKETGHGERECKKQAKHAGKLEPGAIMTAAVERKFEREGTTEAVE